MNALTMLLGRVTVLSVMIAVCELLLPSGHMKGGVRLIAGLVVAEAMIELIFAIPAALGL